MERQITIRYGKEDIAASLHYPADTAQKKGRCKNRVPLVVICHGFLGSRIGVDRLFVNAARELAASGYLVLRFDYLGCGESSGSYGQEGLESMIDQTKAVLDYAIGCSDVDPTQVTLIGHSLGGAVAAITAAKDRRVKHLVLWSAVGQPYEDIVNITGREVYDEALKNGHADFQGYEMTPVFFESLKAIQPLQEIVKFSGSVLVLHGTADEVIPAEYASRYQEQLWKRSEGRCDIELIEQANHTYSSCDHRRQLIRTTNEWLDRQEEVEESWQHYMI